MLVTSNVTSTSNITGTEKRKLGVSMQNAYKLERLLVEQYKSPVTALRETVVNALETSEKAGAATPVKVAMKWSGEVAPNFLSNADAFVSDGDSLSIEIKDSGEGMSKEFLMGEFTGMGFSTKDEDENAVGGFGIGSKSVLSFTNSAVFVSVKDGIKTVAIMSRGDTGTEFDYHVEETDEANGTTVRFSVSRDNGKRIVKNMGSEFFDYCDPEKVEVTVNDKAFPVGVSGAYKLSVGEATIYSNGNTYKTYRDRITVVNTGNTPYPYKVSRDMLDKLFVVDDVFELSDNGEMVVRIDVDRNSILPSREGLIESEKLEEMIVNAVCSTFNKQAEKLRAELTGAKNAHEWLSKYESIEHGHKGYVLTVDRFATTYRLFSCLQISSNMSYADVVGKTVIHLRDNQFDNWRWGDNYGNPLIPSSISGRKTTPKYLDAFFDEYELSDLHLCGLIRDSYIYRNIFATVLPDYVKNSTDMSVEEYVIALLGLNAVSFKEALAMIKAKGQEVMKANPEKYKNVGRSKGHKSLVNPLNLHTRNGVELLGVKNVVDMVADNTRTIHIVNKSVIDSMTDKVWDVVESKNVVVVSGDKAYTRLSSSMTRRGVNDTKLIDDTRHCHADQWAVWSLLGKRNAARFNSTLWGIANDIQYNGQSLVDNAIQQLIKRNSANVDVASIRAQIDEDIKIFTKLSYVYNYECRGGYASVIRDVESLISNLVTSTDNAIDYHFFYAQIPNAISYLATALDYANNKDTIDVENVSTKINAMLVLAVAP